VDNKAIEYGNAQETDKVISETHKEKILMLRKIPGLSKMFNGGMRTVDDMPNLFQFPEYAPGDALKQYKGGGSYLFNAKIREGVPLDVQDKALQRGLDRDLNALPDYQEPTFRSYDFLDQESLNDFLEQHKPGKMVQYSAYTSSAKTPTAYFAPNGTGMQALMKINGKHGKDLAHVESASNNEQEVLFGRKSMFRVNNIGYSPEMKTYFGEMDEI